MMLYSFQNLYLIKEMSGDNVKMSMITDHNIYHNTDQLYNPLRNALKKSGFPLHYSPARVSLSPDKLASSHLTHQLKQLNAVEAQRIRKTTFIETNRELFPTHHIEKVLGKRFYAVDIQQKIGDPLTPEQIQRIPKNQFEQIVYEFKEDQKPLSSNFYQQQSVSTIKNLRTFYTADSVQQYPKPTLVGLTKSYYGNDGKGEVYTVHEDSKASSQISNRLVNSGVKPYKFNQQMKSSKSSSRIELKGRQGDNYKYNLFSIVDEPFNNGCKPNGCFVDNEICASRRATSKWK